MWLGIGYVVGCLVSVLLWRIDRISVFHVVHKFIKARIKNPLFLQTFYIVIIIVILVCLYYIDYNEIYNFITAFLVIDISSTKRKNVSSKEKAHFYNSISLITRSLLCGFIAPLFFIIIGGNNFAIAYMLIQSVYSIEGYMLFKVIFNILTFIPALTTQLILFIIYTMRNRKVAIDFKGDYLMNCFVRPLLNIDIMAAYIESVNFYYHFNHRKMHYIKSYGEYSNKIDELCIKDYLSLSYGICVLCFILFFLLIRGF
jgi:hypothetical protein